MFKRFGNFLTPLTVHQMLDDVHPKVGLNLKSAVINCSSDLYTSELCCVLPTCNIISCNCLLHQCRRCKSRKHQTKLVLALSYMKQEVKMLNSFPWGQHLVQPICPCVCAGRTKHKMQSGGEAGENILVRKTIVENTMTSKVF